MLDGQQISRLRAGIASHRDLPPFFSCYGNRVEEESA